MPIPAETDPVFRILPADKLGDLFEALHSRGYGIVGPTVRDGAIVPDRIESPTELPMGWAQDLEAGRCRLQRREDRAYFGHQVGAFSWKPFLFSARQRIWSAQRREEGGFTIVEEAPNAPRLAFLGIRPCDLQAILIQDRIFLGDPGDPFYRARREETLLIAVSCVEAAGTCFCASMDCGPEVVAPCDLALTELLSPSRHDFLLRVGSPRGALLAADLPLRPATEEDRAAAHAGHDHARRTQGRRLDTNGLRESLRDNPEHPHWEHIASRCLSCANCTLVCPTCFCHTIEDHTDLDGRGAERVRVWDSCFNLAFSQLGGGHTRNSTRSRYRQWMTHKLSTWWDQFGLSGCVGCGRCIAWCPVGIDITREASLLRAPAAPPTGGPP